jgi:hypothetical protein
LGLQRALQSPYDTKAAATMRRADAGTFLPSSSVHLGGCRLRRRAKPKLQRQKPGERGAAGSSFVQNTR